LPTSITDLLDLLARRQSSFSEPMSVHIGSVRRSVFRAFGKVPPDRGEIGKAIYKIGICLGDDELNLTGGPDSLAVPTLITLSGILEGSLTELAGTPGLPPPPAALAHLERPAAPRPNESARYVADPADALPPEETDTVALARIAAAVDELLASLERNKGLPAPLSKAVNSGYLYVLRAFGKSPPARATRHEIADALDKIKQGLQHARAQRGEPAAAVAAADLERLSRLVESQFAAVERR
jgi:septal ring-binding cell division protein DamX